MFSSKLLLLYFAFTSHISTSCVHYIYQQRRIFFLRLNFGSQSMYVFFNSCIKRSLIVWALARIIRIPYIVLVFFLFIFVVCMQCLCRLWNDQTLLTYTFICWCGGVDVRNMIKKSEKYKQKKRKKSIHLVE